MTRMGTRTLSHTFIQLILALAIGVLVGLAIHTSEMSAWADEAQTSQVITTEASAPVHVSGKWEKWKSGWYFKQKDGSYATGFIQPNSDKCVYYLNGKGLMKTGWIKVKDKWYWGTPQVYNDAGIMYNGNNPYVLAVLSTGASGTHDAKLKKLVRDLNTAQGYLH